MTPSGRDLRPTLAALTEWGDRHAAPAGARPVIFRHRGCGREVHARLVCDCGAYSLPVGSEVLAELTSSSLN